LTYICDQSSREDKILSDEDTYDLAITSDGEIVKHENRLTVWLRYIWKYVKQISNAFFFLSLLYLYVHQRHVWTVSQNCDKLFLPKRSDRIVYNAP